MWIKCKNRLLFQRRWMCEWKTVLCHKVMDWDYPYNYAQQIKFFSFPFFFFHSGSEESTHAPSEQFGYQYSNNHSFDSSLQTCIMNGIGPNKIQIRCWTLSNFIVSEKSGEKEERYSNQKRMSQVIWETREKSKKTGSASCSELYVILKSVTATMKQGKPSSVNSTNLSGAESTASVWAGGVCVAGRGEPGWQVIGIQNTLLGGRQCWFLLLHWRICLVSFFVVLTCIYTFALHWSATPCHNYRMFYYTTFTTLNVYRIYYIW